MIQPQTGASMQPTALAVGRHEYKIPIAALVEGKTAKESSANEPSDDSATADGRNENEEELPPGTIHACEGRKLICASGRTSNPSTRKWCGAGPPARLPNPQTVGAPSFAAFSRRGRNYCSGVMVPSQVLIAVTALRTTASAKEQK
jgi:hypothetical protein